MTEWINPDDTALLETIYGLPGTERAEAALDEYDARHGIQRPRRAGYDEGELPLK